MKLEAIALVVAALTLAFAAGMGVGFETGYEEARNVYEDDSEPFAQCHVWAENDTPGWMCFTSRDVELRMNPPANESGNLSLNELDHEDWYASGEK